MKNLIAPVLLLAIISASCTKIIEVDLNDDDSKRLVVDAQFSTFANQHVIYIGESTNYFSSDLPTTISGATVNISDGTNTFNFTETDPGVYVSNPLDQAMGDVEYTLTVNHAGAIFTASDFCDAPAILDSLEIIPVHQNDDISQPVIYYDLLISTQEKAGFGDYYAWEIYINGVLYNDNISDQIATSDDFLPDGIYLPSFPLTYINAEDVEPGDTITLAQHTISKTTFEAYQAILFQTDFRGGIFDTPPADVPTNLSEGAVGLFSATGESRNWNIIP